MTDSIIFESAARSASENSRTITWDKGHFPQVRGTRLYLDITSVSGTSPTLDLKVQGYNGLADSWFDIPGASFTQKTTTDADQLTIYPDLVEQANSKVSEHIGKQFRVVAELGGVTPSFTFSLGADLLQ